MEPEDEMGTPNAWEVATESGSDVLGFIGDLFGGDDDEGDYVDPGSYTPGLPQYPGGGGGGIIGPGVGAPIGPMYASDPGMVQRVVEFVISSPAAQAALKRALGIVFDRAPRWGGQAIEKQIVSVLWRQLPKKYQEPLAQRLAGMDSPIALDASQQDLFLAMWLLDAFRALGVNDISDLLD